MIITQDSLPSNFADVKCYLADILSSISVVELSHLDLQKCPDLRRLESYSCRESPEKCRAKGTSIKILCCI
jgi:hypothetical protein